MKAKENNMDHINVELFNRINNRIDDVEELLRLIIVNNLIDDAGHIVRIEDELVCELRELFEKYDVEYGGMQSINGIDIFVVNIPAVNTLRIKDYNLIYFEIRRHFPDKEPVFMFRTILNGVRRKRIIEEGLSFGVRGEELHITTRRIRK